MASRSQSAFVVITDFGPAVVRPETARRLAPLTKRNRFDRRYRTARRDERYVSKIMASVKCTWAEGFDGPYRFGEVPLAKIYKIARRKGLID